MDGIMSILKFLLIFFNFVLFVVGVVVFGIAVWVIVDAPKFTELFDKTKEVVSSEVDTSALELNIYTSVLYAFLVIAAFFVIVAFLMLRRMEGEQMFAGHIFSHRVVAAHRCRCFRHPCLQGGFV